MSFAITAQPNERSGLCRRLELAALDGLSAEGTLSRDQADRIRVQGRLKAAVVQSCVVTLEPVASLLELEFERWFQEGAATVGELVLAMDQVDVEPLDRPEIDVGELVTEELALGLDPYPRSPEAVAETAPGSWTSGDAGPFAALRGLARSEH